MTLSQSALSQALSRPFKYFDRVDSTNDVAKAWLADGALDGALVIANEQTRGRGRLGREWRTPPDSALALSLILKPDKSYLPRLNMTAALSVCEMIMECVPVDAGIKWPNDVIVQGRKVSGVLPEAIWEADQLAGAVLGIGVNVRVDFSGSALRESAISLEQAAGRRLDRVVLITALLRRFDAWYSQIGSPALFDAWRSRLGTLNEVVTFHDLEGVATGVTAEGALLIRDANGRIHKRGAGELVVGARHEDR